MPSLRTSRAATQPEWSYSGFVVEEQMQAIAAKMGLSETAFIQHHETADRAIRFFTPNAEVSLCGHATIASWHLLLEQGLVTPGPYRVDTSGMRQIHCENDGRVAMTKPTQFGPTSLPACGCLPRNPRDTDHGRANLPVQVASTGLHKFSRSRSHGLKSIEPDLDAIEALSRSVEAIGI